MKFFVILTLLAIISVVYGEATPEPTRMDELMAMVDNMWQQYNTSMESSGKYSTVKDPSDYSKVYRYDED